MKKVWFVLLSLMMVGGLFLTTGEAAQWCWQLDSTNDTFDGYLKVVVTTPDPNNSWVKAVHGLWYQPDSFWIPVSGNMLKNPGRTSWFMELKTIYVSGHYGIAATLDPSTRSGSAVLNITDDGFSENNCTFTKIACSALPPYSAP